MIFLEYQSIADFNQSGVEGLMRYVSEIVPIFWPLVLFGLFLIIFLGTFFAGNRFSHCFAVASIITSLIAFFLSLLEGVIPEIAVVISVVVAVLSVVLLFMTKDE